MKSLFRKTVLNICSKIQDYYGGRYVSLWFSGEKVSPFIHSKHIRIKEKDIILINWDKRNIEIGQWETDQFSEKTK